MIPPQFEVPFFMFLHEPVAIPCCEQHPKKGRDPSEATGDYIFMIIAIEIQE